MATGGGYPPAVRYGDRERPRNPARVVRAWDLGDPPQAPARTRSLVRQALGGLSVTGQAADDILLAADELVANACEHGSGPRELRISWDAGELLCEVVDADLAHWPAMAPPEGPVLPGPDDLGGLVAALEEHGRGLGLVRRLCDRCGVHRTRLLTRPAVVGKGVWFTRSPEQGGEVRPRTPARTGTAG